MVIQEKQKAYGIPQTIGMEQSMAENGVDGRPSGALLRIRRFCVCLGVCFSVFCLGITPPVSAQEALAPKRAERPRQSVAQIKQNAQAKQIAQTEEMAEAVKNIPWSELSPARQRKIRAVVSSPSLFRRLPQQKIAADPEMFDFLVTHPDIVVGFWKKLGVTDLTLQQQEDQRFLMRETTGTTAVAEVLYRTSHLCIVYGRGRYRGPFLAKPYDGEVLLILRNRFLRVSQEPMAVCDLDAFVRIENAGADLFAKLFATSLGKIADSNFEQTLAFVSHVYEAATINPDSLRTQSLQLNSVRENVRKEFGDVIDRVALRAARRHGRSFPEYFVFATQDAGTPPIFSTPSILPHKNVGRSEHSSDEMRKIPWKNFDDMSPPERADAVENVVSELSPPDLSPPTPLRKSEDSTPPTPLKPQPLPQLSSVDRFRGRAFQDSAFQDSAEKNHNSTPESAASPQGKVVFGVPKITRQHHER